MRLIGADDERVVGDGDGHLRPGSQPGVDQQVGDAVVEFTLNHATQRPSAVFGLIAAIGDPVHGFVADGEADLLARES